MNVVIILNFLIAKIYHALIIFSFSQRHNLLRIANSALKKKDKKEDKEDEENKEKEENNKKKKIIKKVKTRRKWLRSRDKDVNADKLEIKTLIKR